MEVLKESSVAASLVTMVTCVKVQMKIILKSVSLHLSPLS